MRMMMVVFCNGCWICDWLAARIDQLWADYGWTTHIHSPPRLRTCHVISFTAARCAATGVHVCPEHLNIELRWGRWCFSITSPAHIFTMSTHFTFKSQHLRWFHNDYNFGHFSAHQFTAELSSQWHVDEKFILHCCAYIKLKLIFYFYQTNFLPKHYQ